MNMMIADEKRMLSGAEQRPDYKDLYSKVHEDKNSSIWTDRYKVVEGKT